MPKTATDPFVATNVEPVSAGRHAIAVTPNDAGDLSHVTSSLIVTVGSGGSGIAVIFADDLDNAPVAIPLAVGSYQLSIQVRRVMATGTALGTGGAVIALWSQ
jgi:hypothetical protein